MYAAYMLHTFCIFCIFFIFCIMYILYIQLISVLYIYIYTDAAHIYRSVLTFYITVGGTATTLRRGWRRHKGSGESDDDY